MSNINLLFLYQGKNLSMQCQESDKLNDVFQRFATKVQRNVNDLQFYYNAKEVPSCDKTLFNLQIKSYQTFNVVDKTIIGA